MHRALASGLLVLCASGMVAGCSSDSSSSADGSAASGSSASSTAICGSVEDLQASLAVLASLPVTADGFSALQDTIGVVASDVTAVVDDVQAQFETQADALSADASALEDAVGQAIDTPSPATLSAVVSAVGTLVDSSTALAKDLAPDCETKTAQPTATS
jgi:hypothetical protein